MYYIVYKTTNVVNGKFYIGAHRGDTLDDSYLGSGHLLKYAIKKYGKSNFIRETLFIFDNSEEMFLKEAELVTEEFVNDKNTYNLKEGGIGLDSATAKKNRESTNEKLKAKYGEDWRRVLSNSCKDSRLRAARTWREENPDIAKVNRAQGNCAALSDTAKRKRKETMKSKGHSQGEKNSQFGTMWINNSIENKKIKKDAQVPDGWVKGRKI